MTEMVERVARAILNAHAGDIPVHDADLQWSWWIEEARAAIEAMREPTEGMRQAGKEADESLPVVFSENSVAAGTIWQAMINAALSPTETGTAGG